MKSMHNNSLTCLFLRPHKEFVRNPDRNEVALRQLEDAIFNRLTIYRRDDWSIIHYFPVWPSPTYWPRGCEARGSEPVYYGPITNIRIHQPKIEAQDETIQIKHSVTLIGVSSANTVQTLRTHLGETQARIKTDPLGFVFSESLESRLGINVQP